MRSMSLPSMAWAIIACSPVQNTAAWTETSTNCASPVSRRHWWATSAPTALSAAAWCHVWGTVTRSGRRSGSPLSAIAPPIAASVRSVAAWSAYGPGLAERRDRDVDEVAAGRARIASNPMPRPSITPGPAFSTTKSAVATRRRRSARPAGVVEVEHDTALAPVVGVEAQAGEAVRLSVGELALPA